MYRNVHKAILERLNRRKSDMTTITRSTSLDATTQASITSTPTTIVTTSDKKTTLPDLGPNKKKRKRREKSSAEYEANDLRFVEIDPETDDNGILAMSLLLVAKGDIAFLFQTHKYALAIYRPAKGRQTYCGWLGRNINVEYEVAFCLRN